MSPCLLSHHRLQHKSIPIFGLKEMLSAVYTVLISLRPDLHRDIFVEQSDLLFKYMGVNCIRILVHVYLCASSYREEVL